MYIGRKGAGMNALHKVREMLAMPVIITFFLACIDGYMGFIKEDAVYSLGAISNLAVCYSIYQVRKYINFLLNRG